MLTTTRRAIQYPNSDRSDRADMAVHIGNIALAADVDVLFTQGTDAARLAAAHQTGGGRFWWASDTLLMWYDDGTTWRSLAPTTTMTGTLAAMPAATSLNAGYLYFASDDQGGRIYRSNGTIWTAISVGLSDPRLSDWRVPTSNSVDNSKVVDGALTPAKIAGTAVIASDSRLSDQRTPLPNSVDNTKIVDNTIAPAKIAGTAVINSDPRLSDQRTPADGSVTTVKIVDGNVTLAKMAVNSVDSSKIVDGAIVDADVNAAAGIAPSKIAGTAVVTADARLSDQRTPLDNSVTSAKIVDGAIGTNDLANGAVTAPKLAAGSVAMSSAYGTVFPTTGLFTGYMFTLFAATGAPGYNTGALFMYRPDLNATYPWFALGNAEWLAGGNANQVSIVVPRTGYYLSRAVISGNADGGTLTITGSSRSALSNRNSSVSVDYVNCMLEDAPLLYSAGNGTIANWTAQALSMSLAMVAIALV